MIPFKSGAVRLASTLMLLGTWIPAGASPADFTDQPVRDYTLELTIRPVGDSPLIDRLGSVNLTVFPQGIHLDSTWLDGYSKRGTSTVVLKKPIARIYALMPLEGFRSVVRRMAGSDSELMPGLGNLTVDQKARGKVSGMPATRHRIMLGEGAWVDVWTSDTIPHNSQLQRLTVEILSAVSEDAGRLSGQISGVPVFIQINTADHPKETILAIRSLRRSSAGAAEMLDVGSFYLRVSAAERLWAD